MIRLTSFTPIPNILIDQYLSKGEITSQEYIVMSVLYRKTYGWHKERERIKNKDLAQLCNIPESSCRKAAASLNEKDLIDIIYVCPECEALVEYDGNNYQCGKCQSKTTPYKVYEPKIEEINDGSLFNIEDLPPVPIEHPPAHTEHPPCSHIAPPLLTHSRVTASKPNKDVELQPPKETLLKETLLKEISQGESLTKSGPESVSENFEKEEERENFENQQIREEEREESNLEIEDQQTENQYPEEKLSFVGGILDQVGNESAFGQEKKTGREDQSSEKEIRDLLNTYMCNSWNMQISENDNVYIKEIMKFPYKDVKASCDDRISINRPAIPKLFTKWVLDGLRLGIKEKKSTQLEKEAFLEDELEKYYQNGKGDKNLCKDVLEKLYSVIQNICIVEHRYGVVINWCEWQY